MTDIRQKQIDYLRRQLELLDVDIMDMTVAAENAVDVDAYITAQRVIAENRREVRMIKRQLEAMGQR